MHRSLVNWMLSGQLVAGFPLELAACGPRQKGMVVRLPCHEEGFHA